MNIHRMKVCHKENLNSMNRCSFVIRNVGRFRHTDQCQTTGADADALIVQRRFAFSRESF